MPESGGYRTGRRPAPAALASRHGPRPADAAGYGALLNRRPAVVAQRAAMERLSARPARGPAVVQRTEEQALVRANAYLRPKATTFDRAKERKYEMSASQWQEVVAAWNRGQGAGVRLRYVYDPAQAAPARASASGGDGGHGSGGALATANQALSGLGYAEMGQSALDHLTTTSNPVSSALHSIAPPVTAMTSGRSAYSQGAAASSSASQGDPLGAVRHGIASFSYAVKAGLAMFTGGMDPVSYAATAVAHLMQAPEYRQLANETLEKRQLYLIKSFNALIARAPDDMKPVLRAEFKKHLPDVSGVRPTFSDKQA